MGEPMDGKEGTLTRRPGLLDHPHSLSSRQSGNGLLRSLSEQIVLETILARGPVSRAHVAKVTGLSKPTVSSVVAGLETCGLVRVCGSAVGNVGRPAVLYEVDRRAGYVFAVDLGGTKVRAGLADLYGVVVEEVVEPTRREEPLQQIAQLFEHTLGRAGLERGLVRAAAIGVPGVYHPASKTVSAAYNVSLAGVNIQRWLDEALGLPLVIDNDVNLAAVGERWRGLASGCDNFVALSVGTGIGMGIVIDGEIRTGASGAAGELGFLPVGVDDPFDAGHQVRGPFESAASGSGLLRRLREMLDDDPSTSLSSDSTLPEAFAAAAKGDRVAVGLVEHEARLLALAIAAVSSILDPELVVLGGGIGSSNVMLPAVRRYAQGLLPRQPRIEVSGLGERAALCGALAAGLSLARAELLREVATRAAAD